MKTTQLITHSVANADIPQIASNSLPMVEIWGVGIMLLSAVAFYIKEEIGISSKRNRKILDQANAYIDSLKDENVELKRKLENLENKYWQKDAESDDLKIKVAQLEKIMELSGPLLFPPKVINQV